MVETKYSGKRGSTLGVRIHEARAMPEPRQPSHREEGRTQRPYDGRGAWDGGNRKKARLAGAKTATGGVKGENKDGTAGPPTPWEEIWLMLGMQWVATEVKQGNEKI